MHWRQPSGQPAIGSKNLATERNPEPETPIWLKCHYEQSEAIQGECYANKSS